MDDTSLDMNAVRKGAERILSPDIDLFVRLSHDIDKRILRVISASLAPLGVSQTQALFIIYMSYYPERIVYQNVLEKTFGLTNPTVTASVRSLENKGIIDRTQDPDDGRYTRLTLTDKGKELYAPCVNAFLDANNTIMDKLTVVEEQQFLELCKKILK